MRFMQNYVLNSSKKGKKVLWNYFDIVAHALSEPFTKSDDIALHNFGINHQQVK